MSSQYYLSLGTGIHQLPLIEAAKKLKLKVIGVDQNAQSPGMAICDLKIQESIYNYRKIFYKINSLLIDGEIVGGYSASFGKALLSWSYLAEKLRVGGISRPLMERLLDKYEVRKMLSEVHIKAPSFSQPKFIAGRSGIVKKQLNDIKGGFHAPYIVKPRSGWGKKDIYEIDDVKHFRKLFGKKNLIENGILPSSFIIEEKIEGDEITVTGLVQNFCFIPVCVTDKITSKKAPFIELEHRSPSKHFALLPQIDAVHQEIVKTFNITDTPIVSEWKIKNNQLYLIEISAQIPGEFIAGFLIPEAMSYDFYKNLVKLTLGRNIDRPKDNLNAKPVVIKYFTEKIPQDEIVLIKKESSFFSILNENPKVPPEGNHDRYAVAGYVG